MNNAVTEELKYISLDQLLPGDILGFKGDPQDTISFLIMYLTNGSDVSHGALFVQNKDNVLAESGGDGIHSRKMFEDKENGREVYVLRHKLAGPNGVEPVVPIAKDYVLQDLPYPYSDLILLGLILLFKRNVKKNLVSKAVVEYLCLVAAELKTIIEKDRTQGRHTMVCSSFVYQCYLDASKDHPRLKLQVEDGDVGFKDHPLIGAAAHPARSLFDLYQEYVASHKEECKASFYGENKLVQPKTMRSKDEIIDDLKQELLEEAKEHFPALDSIDPTMLIEIVNAVKDVVKALGEFVNKDFTFEEMLENARKQQAMFVTPNDLVKHLANADLLGVAKVHCDNQRYDANFRYCCDFLGGNASK